MTDTNVTFASDALTLEGRLSLPQGRGPFAGIVLCHPHPLYGGDMNNNVVEGMANVLVDRQMAVLAFNFRGVGRSEGSHDRGTGEVADALAAVHYLASQLSVDRDRLGIAGYSFGSVVTLNAAVRDQALKAIAVVACPTPALDNPEIQQTNQPKLFVQGDMDQVVQLDMFHDLIQRFQSSTEVDVLPGADHFLLGYELQIGSRVAEFFGRMLG